MASNLISVVIPTYNSAKYLPEALNSVIAQTYTNWEIIIIDDGSTDNTYEMVEPFLQDKRVSYIKQENQGAANARNNGILRATGDFITTLDSDDIWDNKKLELQLSLVDGFHTIVFTSIVRFDSNLGLNALLFQTDPPLFNDCDSYLKDIILLKDSHIANFCTGLIPKTALVEVGFYDQSLITAEDWDLWIRLAFTKKYAFKSIMQPLVYYRKYSDSLTRRYHFCKTFENQLFVLKKVKKTYQFKKDLIAVLNSSKIERHIFFFEKALAHKCYLDAFKIWGSATSFLPFYDFIHFNKLLKWPLRILFHSVR